MVQIDVPSASAHQVLQPSILLNWNLQALVALLELP